MNTTTPPITLPRTAAPVPFGGRPTVIRAGSAAQASEFQASMQKNRSSRPSAASDIKPDSKTWKAGAPLEDQPPAWVASETEPDCRRQNLYQADPDTPNEAVDPRAVLDRTRFGAQSVAASPVSVEAHEGLVSSLAEKLDTAVAASGQFEVLLPSGHGIGVHYEVSSQVTQVLLRARSALLSQQLKQCADDIGTSLSQRCGRPVEVTAI